MYANNIENTSCDAGSILVFTAPLHNNGSYPIVACVFFAAGMCLPRRSLAMSLYVAVFKVLQLSALRSMFASLMAETGRPLIMICLLLYRNIQITCVSQLIKQVQRYLKNADFNSS
jgi:hypothetical protein